MSDLNPQNIAELDQFLRENDSFVVTTHNSPDGDAMGSSIAMCYFLHQVMGKKVTLVLPDVVSDSLKFICSEGLPFSMLTLPDAPQESAQAFLSAGAIICLDFNALHRSRCGEFVSKATCPKLLIDHHLAPERESFDMVFSECEISSACEWLYNLLMALPQVNNQVRLLPSQTREALMLGMTTDTNNFANSVYPSTLRMASSLLESGVDRDDIIYKLFFSYRENRLRAQGYVLSQKMTLADHGVAYIILSKAEMEQFDLIEGDTEGFVNMPLSLASVKMSIFIRELTDRYRVSIRSKKGTSANQWAAMCFNGGGHENASGGTLYKTDFASVDQVEEYVKSAIVRFFEK